MQAYGEGFARVYNARWSSFARQVAPYLYDYYQRAPIALSNPNVLDLCCGTGQLGLYFLERGYRVTGIDLSEAMLHYARENAADYLGGGRARYERGDASKFSIAEKFGLVFSTYDALNHLEDLEALKQCFRSVYAALVDGGLFVFDLNTRLGLKRWNNINVEESEDALIVTRGLYDGRSERAWTKISGFVRVVGGTYQRFDEMVFNTVFEMTEVKRALAEAGWARIHFARIQDLTAEIEDPERESRVFVVAWK
jgi:SAM-dependent methyltransferase